MPILATFARRSLAALTALAFVSAPLAFAEESSPAAAKLDPIALRQDASAKLAARQWGEAAALLERSCAENPHVGVDWFDLGTARYNLKEWDAAIAAYSRALDLRAGFPSVSAYNIACCEAQKGDEEKALAWIARALDLGFRNLESIRDDDDFASLRGDERFRRLVGLFDPSGLSRDEGWRADLALLAREIARLHYDPFRLFPRAEFDAEVKRIHDAIPALSDNEISVAMARLVARVGDGHTSLAPRAAFSGEKAGLPVQFYLFPEGLHVIAADPRFRDLVGARVLRCGAHPAEKAVREVQTLLCRDNEMTLHWLAPQVLRMPGALNGLGLVPSDKSVELTVADEGGRERTVALPADSGGPDDTWIELCDLAPAPLPLYLKDRESNYWFEHVPGRKLVYCQYNRVRNDPKEPIEAFARRLFRYIEEHDDVEKLVLDMRHNNGGNNFLNRPLVEGLMRSDKINVRGRLFVIVGRNTFSAAMCGAAQIERHTNAIFVGEPTGSSPNFIGESVEMTLPFSRQWVSISDLYWQNSVAMDYRTWIAPRLYAPPAIGAARANRDPAMEAILALP